VRSVAYMADCYSLSSASYVGGLNNTTSIFFADHDDGRSRARWVLSVIGGLDGTLLIFKTHRISPT
jgi:hypothetical protein